MILAKTGFFLSVFFISSGCASSSDTNLTGLWISEDLSSAIKAPDKTFSRKRTPLKYNTGELVDNCKSYFLLKKKSSVTEGVNNFIAAQDYVECDTVRAVQGVRKNRFVRSGLEILGKVLAEGVALNSFRSSAYRRTDASHNNMLQVFGSDVKTDRYSAIADMEDWYYALTVKARLDLDGDGSEDWIVWLNDQSKSGNYSTVAAFCIYNVAHGSTFELKPLT